MNYNSRFLLDSLQADVRSLVLQANQLRSLPSHLLRLQPSFQQWSPAQVLEHLNIYARHYIKAMEEALHLNEHPASAHFRPGWLGNYFTKLMMPGENNTVQNKMKAPKNAVPALRPDAMAQLEEFLQHQHHLLNLLEIARNTNLGAIRIPTTLHKLIRLKLGDTFRFFIAHEQRHFVQLQNALAVLEKSYNVEVQAGK
jgi:hypothetical protein